MICKPESERAGGYKFSKPGKDALFLKSKNALPAGLKTHFALYSFSADLTAEMK